VAVCEILSKTAKQQEGEKKGREESMIFYTVKYN
jgi:hypothetical protein